MSLEDRAPNDGLCVQNTDDLYVYRGSGSINSSTTFWSGISIGNWPNHTNLTN